jgi:hypothetical protein
LITGASFTDTGLIANTTYFYVVKSVDNTGAMSAPSSEISATTQTAPTCFTATNFDHIMTGRAHDTFSVAVANGSNQVMGLDNVFVVTTLKQTGPDFYVIGSCPCVKSAWIAWRDRRGSIAWRGGVPRKAPNGNLYRALRASFCTSVTTALY